MLCGRDGHDFNAEPPARAWKFLTARFRPRRNYKPFGMSAPIYPPEANDEQCN